MIVEDHTTMQLYGHAPDLAEHLPVPNAYDLIRDWIRRGLITPHRDPDGKEVWWDGRPVYSFAAIAAVEKSTRQNGKKARRLTRWPQIPQSMP